MLIVQKDSGLEKASISAAIGRAGRTLTKAQYCSCRDNPSTSSDGFSVFRYCTSSFSIDLILLISLLANIRVNSLKLLYTYRLSGADKIDIGFITEDLQGSFFVTKDIIRKII